MTGHNDNNYTAGLSSLFIAPMGSPASPKPITSIKCIFMFPCRGTVLCVKQACQS